jgi:hypothetical protein
MHFYYPTMHKSIKVEPTLLSLLYISDRSMYFMRNHSINANDLTWDKIYLCMYDFQNVAQTWQED